MIYQFDMATGERIWDDEQEPGRSAPAYADEAFFYEAVMPQLELLFEGAREPQPQVVASFDVDELLRRFDK